MLALVSIGIHLSVQQHAQQQAEALIQQWGRDAGVEIGNVRYHLLRNGLVLQNIRVHRGNESLNIKHILVQANPRLLTGGHPRIGHVTVSGVEATLQMKGGDSDWLHEQRLLQLWQAARAFTLRGGRLTVYASPESTQPLVFTDVSFNLKTRDAVREFSASARLRGGLLQGQWSRTASQSRGKAGWQQLDATLLMKGLDLRTIKGQFSGALTWESTPASAGQVGSNTIEGQIRLLSAVGSVRSHQMQWKANEKAGQWRIDMNADGWPLHPWSDLLPHLGRRQLTAGEFDGDLHWLGKPGAWMISSKRGALYDITYAADQMQAWYWSRILYEHALLDTSLYRMNVGSAELNDSRLVLDTRAHKADAAPEGPWRIRVGRMTINNMMLALLLPHGKLTLPKLNGQGSWPANKPLSFDMTTVEPATTQASKPDAAWHLRSIVGRGAAPTMQSDFNVIGNNIALPTLRALLPFRADAGHAASLAGSTDLNVNVSIRQGQWQMQGKASIRDMRLSHGDSVWSAASVSTVFGPIGMGLDFQHINAIKASDWHYVTALQPLSATAQGGGQNNIDARQIPWWVAALKENHCRIDALHWQNGTFSIGRSDARWAEDINVDMQHIAPDSWAETKIQGVAGAAPFSLNGEWDILSAYERMRGRARIDNALPFFLHDWMRASGMPPLIRGRLSAYISIAAGATPDSWLATVNVSLKRGLLVQQETPSDPMLTRTGYKTAALLSGLQNKQMIVGLSYTVNGPWSQLTSESLGKGLLDALRKGMQEHADDKPMAARKDDHLETRIRLREDKRLSLNERSRLRKVALKARRKPAITIDLRPEWASATLSAKELARIQQTQQAIERYLNYLKIDSGRIFPIWPTDADHASETGSIWVETVQ